MVMPTLKQYQRWFCEAARQEDQELPNSQLISAVSAGGKLSQTEALDVYRTGHIVRLTEALGETFEAVWWVAGDNAFFQLAKDYILSHPSSVYNLSAYGDRFPDFLAQNNPFPDLPFLSELARFEWLFKETFHVRQHEAVSSQAIIAMEPMEILRFSFGPSAHLFSSPYTVYETWKLRGTDQKDGTEFWKDQAEYLFLYKKHHQIFVNTLQYSEYKILSALLSGASIEESVSSVAAQCPEMDQPRLQVFFQLLVYTGSIEKIFTG